MVKSSSIKFHQDRLRVLSLVQSAENAMSIRVNQQSKSIVDCAKAEMSL